MIWVADMYYLRARLQLWAPSHGHARSVSECNLNRRGTECRPVCRLLVACMQIQTCCCSACMMLCSCKALGQFVTQASQATWPHNPVE